jgi:hypothetical protein
VTDAVVRCDVANFKRLYEDPGMHDGEQWVLCLEQAEHRRVVYCNNHFAPGIRAFRDALLHVVGTALVWQPVEASRHRAHERALWQANRDEPIAR